MHPDFIGRTGQGHRRNRTWVDLERHPRFDGAVLGALEHVGAQDRSDHVDELPQDPVGVQVEDLVHLCVDGPEIGGVSRVPITAEIGVETLLEPSDDEPDDVWVA